MWHWEKSRSGRPQCVSQSHQTSRSEPDSEVARDDSVAASSLRPNESMDRLVDTFSKSRSLEQEVIILPPVQSTNMNSEVTPSTKESESIDRARPIDPLVHVWRSAFTDAAATFKDTSSSQNTKTESRAMPTWPFINPSNNIDAAWAQTKVSKGEKVIPNIESPEAIDAAWAQAKTPKGTQGKPNVTASHAKPTIDLAAPIESHLLKESIARDLMNNLPRATPASADTSSGPAPKPTPSSPSTRRPLVSESAQEPSLDPVPHDEAPLPNNEDNSQFSLPAEDTVPVPKWWSNLLDKVRRG